MNYNLFDTLLDAVVVVDDKKRIVYANDVFGQMCNTNVFRLIKSQATFDSVITFDVPPFDLTKPLHEFTAAIPYSEVGYKAQDKQGKVAVTLQPFPPENMTQATSLWVIFMRDVLLEETLQKKYKAELGQKEQVITELQVAQEKLKDYSKNLEKMVAERTAELAESNLMLGAMLNSLGQGFLVFNKEGLCSDIYSKACLNLLEANPSGLSIWEVLRVPEKKWPDFKKWCTFLFEEKIPFEDLLGAAPKLIEHSKKLHVTLEYYPIRDADDKITEVCVVATDKTSELEAQKQAKIEKTLAERVMKLTKNKSQFWRFVNESMNNLASIRQNMALSSVPDIDMVFRLIHTLKGDAGAFRVSIVAEAAHLFETELDRFRTIPDQSKIDKKPFISKATEKIEQILNSFLRENRDIVGDFRGASGKKLEISFQDLTSFEVELKKLTTNEKIISIYEEGFLKEPISRFFSQYDDLMTTIAQRTRKQVKPLRLVGGDLKIFENPYSALLSSFVHIIRNSVDHGFETPLERQDKGKDPNCELKVEFSKFAKDSSTWIRIVFQDDGRGIDPAKIKEKMTSRGVNIDQEDDKKVIQHIFDAGFSTASAVTEFSGRGMGMDAVQNEVKKIGGSCFVESVLGSGTKIVVEFPELSLKPSVDSIQAA